MATTGHESEAINVQGLKASLQNLKNAHIDSKAEKASITAGSYNKVTVNGQGIVTGGSNPDTLAGHGITDAYTKSETYTKTEVNGLVDTPHQEYVTVSATSQTTDVTTVLPNSGQSADTIYRVSNWDGSANSGAGAFDVTKYSEYAWDDVSSPNKYVFLCVKSQLDEVFDISVYNNNAQYADLKAALGTNGANVPQSLQRGGMSVKFVQSSDNKYVQFRLMLSGSFTTAQFTNEANWQGVDEKPIAGSKSLVESNSLFNGQSAFSTMGFIPNDTTWTPRVLKADGTTGGAAGHHHSGFIPVTPGSWYYYAGSKPSNSFASLCGYSAANESDFVSVLDSNRVANNGSIMEVVIPTGINYVRVGFVDSITTLAGIWKITTDSVLKNEIDISWVGFETKAEKLFNANLINPSEVESGKRIKPDGTITTLDNSFVSGFIPVTKGQSITMFNTHPTSTVIAAYAVYDVNKQFIRSVASNVATYTQQGNECYVKLCMPVPNDSYPTLFANYGNSLLPYSPYKTMRDAIAESKEGLDGKLDKQYGSNLVDMSKVTPKSYINTSGAVKPIDDVRYFVSDFIPVNGQDICTNAYARNSEAIRGFAVYGSDKTTVVRVGAKATNSYEYQAGDVYVIFSFYSADFTTDYPTAFASYGSTIAPYLPYTEFAPVMELQKELNERVPPKTQISIVFPDYVYSICDDVENNSVALYADHFADLSREPHKLLFKSSGTDKINIFAPISLDGSELNGGVNRKQTSLSDVIIGDFKDAAFSLVHRSILNTRTANIGIRVLCIGDSVTNGTGSNFPKEVTGDSNFTYWRLMQMFCLRDKKNHNNAGYNFLSIGKQSSVTYTYDNAQHKVFAEGRGGWAISNYLYDETAVDVSNLFYDANKVWTGDYATELNAAGVKFSLASYLAKYKTLADDGVTRLVPGSTAGTEIVDAMECDVCTPNIIVLQLTHNNGGNADFYKDDMPLMIKAIKNEYPDIPIILSAIDETGCYNTQLYPMVDANEATYKSLHTQIVKVVGEIKDIVADFTNVWYCPCNFIQPTALSMTTRPVNRAESLVKENSLFDFGAEFGAGANFHPSAFANAAWAYEMLACIKWVLTE